MPSSPVWGTYDCTLEIIHLYQIVVSLVIGDALLDNWLNTMNFFGWLAKLELHMYINSGNWMMLIPLYVGQF